MPSGGVTLQALASRERPVMAIGVVKCSATRHTHAIRTELSEWGPVRWPLRGAASGDAAIATESATTTCFFQRISTELKALRRKSDHIGEQAAVCRIAATKTGSLVKSDDWREPGSRRR